MRPERWLAWLARIARVVSWPFARFDIEGGDKLNAEVVTGVIVTNHRSLYDIAAGLIVFHKYRRYPRVLIEKKYVDSKLVGPFARAIGAIPVDRGAGKGEAFRAAVEALDSGLTILLLPEGRLHWNPDDPFTTGPASTGTSRLAHAADVPVVAAGMIGTEQVWPAHRPIPYLNPFRRRPVVTVRISQEAVELQGDDHHERTDLVMADVRRMMLECQDVATARTAS